MSSYASISKPKFKSIAFKIYITKLRDIYEILFINLNEMFFF
jgi:hypothetical protein